MRYIIPVVLFVLTAAPCFAQARPTSGVSKVEMGVTERPPKQILGFIINAGESQNKLPKGTTVQFADWTTVTAGARTITWTKIAPVTINNKAISGWVFFSDSYSPQQQPFESLQYVTPH
jgi:hypothetical protein